MTKTRTGTLATVAALLLGCSDMPTDSRPIDPPAESVAATLAARGAKPGGGGGGTSDPAATFTLEGSGALGVFDDGHGPYENGKCGVEAKIFATTAASGSGDAILDTSGKHRKCSHSPRTATLVFTNNSGSVETELVTLRINVHEVQTPITFIPIGATETRGMNLNPWSGSRCENIHFKEELQDGTTTGAQPVEVTRLAGDTWQVRSQAGGKAYCADGVGGELIDLPVDFTIVTSTALPS